MKHRTFLSKIIPVWKVRIIPLLIIAAWSQADAQEVAVQVSYDTVYAGNVLAVLYSMENWRGDMDDPDFGDFVVAGGPQISSSMSYSNGERKSSKSIVFHLLPPEAPGMYLLPSITFTGEDHSFSTPEVPIVVLDNPEGIEQNPVIAESRPFAMDKKFQNTEPSRGQRQRF